MERVDKWLLAGLTFGVLVAAPVLALGFIFLMSTINWHDVLLVVSLVGIQFQLCRIRKENRKAIRATRRAVYDGMAKHSRSGLYDAYDPAHYGNYTSRPVDSAPYDSTTMLS